ncbi:MAG: DUF1646 family protein [Thermoplasmata archaeon]
MDETIIMIFLIIILILILILPILWKRVEENLEIFFLIMGIVASIIAGSLNLNLIYEALMAPLFIHNIPIGIFQVVLIGGIIFAKYIGNVENGIKKMESVLGLPLVASILIFILGISSSIISAIVASLLVAEISRVIPIEKKKKNVFLVLSAYSIGLGASLTPVGEPLSTILVQKLSGPPYHANFFFPFHLLIDYILPLIIIITIFSYFVIKNSGKKENDDKGYKLSYTEAIWRAVKIYIFVFSLVLLGSSFDLIVMNYIVHLSPSLMYLFGATSAFLDNATLTAAIISPSMGIMQIKSFIISLLISGGFLIPGNVPNIVIAYTHKISFKEWAKIALPIGIPFFIIFFFIINI